MSLCFLVQHEWEHKSYCLETKQYFLIYYMSWDLSWLFLVIVKHLVHSPLVTYYKAIWYFAAVQLVIRRPDSTTDCNAVMAGERWPSPNPFLVSKPRLG